jgi:hypothetical protein
VGKCNDYTSTVSCAARDCVVASREMTRDKKLKTAMYMRRLLDYVKEIKKTVQKQEKSNRDQREHQPGSDPPEREVRAVVRLDDQTVRDIQANDDKTHSTQQSIAKATWFAFGAAAIYAAISSYQACEIHRSTVAAQKSADAAEQSVSLTQAQAREDRRAWIEMQFPATIQVEAGKPVSIPVTYRNTGKTPALQLSSLVVVQMLPLSQAPALSYALGIPRNIVTSGILFPDSPTPFSAVWLNLKPTPQAMYAVEQATLSADDFKRWKNGEVYFTFYGTAEYNDIFGDAHETRVCGFFGGKNNIQVPTKECSDYNGVKDIPREATNP